MAHYLGEEETKIRQDVRASVVLGKKNVRCEVRVLLGPRTSQIYARRLAAPHCSVLERESARN